MCSFFEPLVQLVGSMYVNTYVIQSMSICSSEPLKIIMCSSSIQYVWGPSSETGGNMFLQYVSMALCGRDLIAPKSLK
jgi:hypothetical protein